MAFMRYFTEKNYGRDIFSFNSTQKKGARRETFEQGDWMFYMSPTTMKIKKTHLQYVEWIMGVESKALSKMDKPDSWAVVNDGKNPSILVFVHDNLEFRAKSMFLINTMLRALWEYPQAVDKWVELVEAGVDKDEALYFMWVLTSKEGGYNTYYINSSGHTPFTSTFNIDNFLAGKPVDKYKGTFFEKGWETGIQQMWGTNQRLHEILKLEAKDRFNYGSKEDLVTLIKNRKG